MNLTVPMEAYELVEGILINTGVEKFPGDRRLHEAFYRLCRTYPKNLGRIVFNDTKTLHYSKDVERGIQSLLDSGVICWESGWYVTNDEKKEKYKRRFLGLGNETSELQEICQKMDRLLGPYAKERK